MKNQQIPEVQAVEALAALAQAQRLRAFRALVVAGAEGLTPSALAALLQLAPSALSFHLKALSHAGLVSAEASGRNLIYRAEFGRMNELLTYLTQDCCQGQSCAVVPEAAKVCC
jgi:DNA-binding transcriptional ArsR family regulator